MSWVEQRGLRRGRSIADKRRLLKSPEDKSPTELAVKLTPSLAELQRDHVVMELECIDRMYSNAYVPQLTSEGGVACYLRDCLGYRFASTQQVAAKTEAFVASMEKSIRQEKLERVQFQKGQRKDDVLQAKLRRFKQAEGSCSSASLKRWSGSRARRASVCPQAAACPGSFVPRRWSTCIISTAVTETLARSF